MPVQLLQSCVTLFGHNSMDCSPSSAFVQLDSPGKNTGMGFHALLQGIFPTQGLSSCLPSSPALQLDSLTTEPPGKLHGGLTYYQIKCQPVARGMLQKNINIYKEYMKVIRIIGGYIETISQKNLCHRSVTKRSSVLFNGSPDWARLIQGNNPV